MRRARLIMVTGDHNNNKYYNMDENGDGSTFTSSFGRVGSSPQKQIYPISKWESTYKSKIKKGYRDITSHKQVGSIKSIEDPQVSQLVSELNRYSSMKVAENYSVSTESVTPSQLDEAQKLVDDITNHREDLNVINKALVDLYTILPRRMRNVKDNLLSVLDNSLVMGKITEEQSLLDNLKSQVVIGNVEGNDQTILDILGLEIYPFTTSDQDILPLLFRDQQHSLSRYFKGGFRVINKKAKESYDAHLNLSSNKSTELLWHGSRNQNYLSILSQSLKIRPSNVAYNGSLYGNGIYFSDSFDKSLGYTYSGDFMSVFEVHVGNQYIAHNTNPSLGLHSISGYDSVLANRIPREYIIYREVQCTPVFFLRIR